MRAAKIYLLADRASIALLIAIEQTAEAITPSTTEREEIRGISMLVYIRKDIERIQTVEHFVIVRVKTLSFGRDQDIYTSSSLRYRPLRVDEILVLKCGAAQKYGLAN